MTGPRHTDARATPVAGEPAARASHLPHAMGCRYSVIGALLVPGGRTPLIISRAMLGRMKQGAVIVDVSIDQGGCVETARPTTHDEPVYEVGGILHYMVANMPGAYPRTATVALANATLPYVRALAAADIEKTLSTGDELRSAVNLFRGHVVNRALADSAGLGYTALDTLLRS